MLKLNNITKEFPGVVALDNVSLEFGKGEIHALLGENGAGKSTLIKIICGIYPDFKGEIILEDERLVLGSYHDALANGISVVNQEIQVIPEASAAENILLDKMHMQRKKVGINWNSLYSTAEKYMRMVGLDVPPETPIGPMSAAQKQLVQIAKALSANSRILILDEPTSSLTAHEAGNLFVLLRKLRDEGVIIIFVSHKLEEIFELCDKVTVIRDGRVIGTDSIDRLCREDLVEMMIGRSCNDEYLGSLDDVKSEPVLEAFGITKKNVINNASFRLFPGEILGFYGLVGSGRTELARLIVGDGRMDSGRIKVKGEDVRIKSMSDALYKYGIGYVTENRKEEGLFLDASIEMNMGISVWKKFRSPVSRRIRDKEVRALEHEIADRLKIKCTGLEQAAGFLSGGNQQKVSISKWLAADCDVLIIDEPTVGVDVGAKEYIHKIIWDLAKEQGKAIILISSDLPEMVKLARRILVFREKRIIGELDDINGRETLCSDEICRRIGHYLV